MALGDREFALIFNLSENVGAACKQVATFIKQQFSFLECNRAARIGEACIQSLGIYGR